MPIEMATAQPAGAETPVLQPIQRLIYQSQRWKLVSFLFAATIVKTGVWCMPNLSDSQQIAQSPFVNSLVPDAQYMFWSWLAPFLAWVVRANGKWSFFVFQLLFSLAFTGLFVLVVFSRLDERDARSSLVLFFVLPVSGTAYFWVGGDSVTLFLMMLALAVSRSTVGTVLVAIALGMQHFEQGFFAAAALACAMAWDSFHHRASTRDYSVRWSLTLLLGVILGKVVLFEMFRYLKVTVNSGRLYWLDAHLHWLLGRFWYHSQLILYSVLGVGWVLVIKYAERGKKAIPFLVALSGLLLLLPITGDHTRVGAIVTFPLIAVYCLLNREYLKAIGSQLVCWVFVVWLIIPYVWVWGGVSKWSAFPYDIAFLLHKAFGWFAVPTNPLWPFKN